MSDLIIFIQPRIKRYLEFKFYRLVDHIILYIRSTKIHFLILAGYNILNNIFLLSWIREKRKDNRSGLSRMPAASPAPRHFIRVACGPYTNKIV
jgi:hypothetical protein